MRVRRPVAVRGFTLLEVMIAMAILAAALTGLVVATSQAIKAENKAKLMATATFLARGKIVDIEDELFEKGFSEFEKELSGGFEDKGFKRFSWRATIDKVELPSNEQVQNMVTKANEARQALSGQPPPSSSSSSSSGSNASGMGPGAGMLSSQFQTIKEVLEQGIRRVTLRVEWFEGKRPQSVVVSYYVTDPRKVDAAINLSIPTGVGGAAPTGAPGSPAPGGGSSGGPAKAGGGK